MTNADKIRNMTDEELNDFLTTLCYNCCIGNCDDCPVPCYEDVVECDLMEFLKKEIVGDME